MALAARESDKDRHKITNATKLATISASFAEGKHTDLQDFPAEGGLLFQIQNIEEDIDEVRRFIISENKSAIDSATSKITTTSSSLATSVNTLTTASGSLATSVNTLTTASGSLATSVNTLTTASSSFANSGGVKTLGVTATSPVFPTAIITGFSHAYSTDTRQHSLTIIVSVTDSKGNTSKLSTAALALG